MVGLEARGHALYEKATKVLLDHRGTHDHLLETLNHQVTKLVELLKELHELAVVDVVHESKNEHKIHVIEEELLHLENRVNEEIDIIAHIKDHHKPSGELTVAQLVAAGEKLIKQAKEAVAKHPKAREVSEIDREIIVVDALLKAIQAKPAPAELKKEEQELARQEKTLQQLIEKANARRD